MTAERENADREARNVALMRAYADVYQHPAGLVVIMDLLGAGGLLEPSHTPGDPHDTAFREGRRSLALHVLERLRVTEMQVLAMAMHRHEPDFDPIRPDAGVNAPPDDAPDEEVF